MATLEQPFAPLYGSGAVVTPAASSANVSGLSSALEQLLLTNLGAEVCYVRTGSTSQTATTADYPVAPGQQAVITKPAGHTHLAHISAAGTTLHYMFGTGW